MKPSAFHFRGVDAHLGAVVGQARGVVEGVDGAEGELDVALGVDVIGDAENDFADVLHVAVFIDDDDALGEHGLTERPDGVHHLARVAGIALLIETSMRLWKTPSTGR